MKIGLDILVKNKFDILKNKKIALLAHGASVDSDYNHIIDLLIANNIDIKVAFGPEHGLKSTAQDMEGVIKEVSDFKIITLYDGTYASLFPKKEDLEDIDIILIDLQDVGSRYYTYVYTASFFLEIAKDLGIKVLVLDRPNPIGRDFEGNFVSRGFESFVGYYSYFLNRHGLTIAEMLSVINKNIGADLKIIPIEGYKGETFYENPYSWVLPSPNMPRVETAFLYPGACLIEGTELSEGRGTTKPFHFVGAPYINSQVLKKVMDSYNLKGVTFREVSFKPMFQKFKNEICNGVEVHIRNYKELKPLKIYLTLIYEIYHLFSDFKWRTKDYEFVKNPIAIDLLLGSDIPRKMIEEGKSVEQIYNFITKQESDYEKNIKKYKIY